MADKPLTAEDIKAAIATAVEEKVAAKTSTLEAELKALRAENEGYKKADGLRARQAEHRKALEAAKDLAEKHPALAAQLKDHREATLADLDALAEDPDPVKTLAERYAATAARFGAPTPAQGAAPAPEKAQDSAPVPAVLAALAAQNAANEAQGVQRPRYDTFEAQDMPITQLFADLRAKHGIGKA